MVRLNLCLHVKLNKTDPLPSVDILNYALTLEHLEATFYREGLAKFSSADFVAAGIPASSYTRLTEVGRSTEGPVFANLFVEHKDVLGLTLRVTAGNLLGADSTFDRIVYVGRRTGSIAFVEQRDRKIGPIFSFSARGKF